MSISSDSILMINPENDVVKGMADSSGQPAIRSQSGFWRSACYIIGVGAAERFAYCGVSSNLITYLTGPMRQSTAGAAATINAWSGAGLLLPILGAFLADSFLGPYLTVLLSSLLYILALGLLTTSAFVTCGRSPDDVDVLFFFVSLYLIALGQGAYKPCILAFGADQFDEQHPHELRSRTSFFNWSYFCLSAAPLAALLLLNYVQDNISWGIGFGIPCISMAAALILFMLGTNSYRYRIRSSIDQERSCGAISRLFVKAALNWRNANAYGYEEEEQEQEQVPHLLYSHKFNFLNYKALVGPDEEAKTIAKLFPIWATSLAFGIAMAQPSTLFTKQGMTMDRSITPSLDIPAASLQYIMGLTVILFIPIYDRALVPLARLITATPSGLTEFQRVGAGMLLCTLSMITAALVEHKRLQTVAEYQLADFPQAKLPISFVWLLPQYIIYGVAEVLTLIGLQELFYDQVPPGLKAVGLSFFLSILGMGQFLSSFLICIIHKITSQGGRRDGWFSDNTNRAHLDHFYCLLALLNAIAFLAFLYSAKYSFNTRTTTTTPNSNLVLLCDHD